MTAIVRGDAAKLPLRNNSVDLVITSPPYFALRSYRDDDGHYTGQIGSEASPADFLEALWAVTDELSRVLRPTGSIFVNLGDKWSGSGGHNNAGVSAKSTLQGNGHVGGGPKLAATRRSAPDRYNQSKRIQSYERHGGLVDVQAKSLMGLPWRYALGACDQLGLILRAELIWSKPNGLPESVTDRVRRNHEQWFHFTKRPHYYAAIDEVREPHLGVDNAKSARGPSGMNRGVMTGEREEHVGNFARDPAGKLPGSVWEIPGEPLIIPDGAKAAYGLPDHFAAFPTEWPRRLIAGWSPPAICLECGLGRRPVVEVDAIVGYACECTPHTDHAGTGESSGRTYAEGVAEGGYVSNDFGGRLKDRPKVGGWREYHLEGWRAPPSRPAVVLDPFGGTGTVAMVARAMGRTGISLDMSADYCRLASWRVFRSGHGQKARDREEEKTVLNFF